MRAVRRWRPRSLNALGDPTRAFAVSAGTALAARVHPEVVEAMEEVGISNT